jgi:hypothetical protein
LTRWSIVADDTGTDPEPTGAERYLADRLRDPKYRAAYAAFRSQFPLPDTADDTGTDWAALADKLLLWSDAANVFEDTDDDRDELLEAAVGLRRLAQLDTAIGDPGNLRLLADTFDLPILRRIADAAVLGSGEQPEPEPVSDESSPYCPCGGSCHRASSPCSLSCVVHHASGCWEQPEGPTTCPTCGSDTPMVCHIGLVRRTTTAASRRAVLLS